MKAALFGFWLCICTILGTWLPHPETEQAEYAPPPRAEFATLPFASGNLMAVTDFRNGAIAGYFLFKFSAVMDNREFPRFEVIISDLLADAAYRFFEKHKVDEIISDDRFETGKLRGGLLEEINSISGALIVVSVLIQQVDYLTIGEVRRKSAARTLVLTP